RVSEVKCDMNFRPSQKDLTVWDQQCAVITLHRHLQTRGRRPPRDLFGSVGRRSPRDRLGGSQACSVSSLAQASESNQTDTGGKEWQGSRQGRWCASTVQAIIKGVDVAKTVTLRTWAATAVERKLKTCYERPELEHQFLAIKVDRENVSTS